MPQAAILRDRAAAFRPRFLRDAIVLGRSTILARRAVERGCYYVEKPDDDALITLLSLAYEKRIHRHDPILPSVLRATGALLKSPERVESLLVHLPEPSAAGIGRLPQAERLLKAGTRPADLEGALRRNRLGLPEAPTYADHLTLCEKGVVLGKGTVIAAFEDSAAGSVSLALKACEERILALLSVASGQAINPGVLTKFEAASRALGGGNVCLAAIHLAQAGLSPLAHSGFAKALSLAASELDRGVGPFDLLKGLDLLPAGMGYADWSRTLRKEGGGNPNHVPAGCPEGGQFCSADQAGGSGKTAKRDLSAEETKRITERAAKWVGTHYADARTPLSGPNATKQKGGDCSGTTQAIFREAGFDYPYTTSHRFAQDAANGNIPFRQLSADEKPQAGDVVLYPGHMAIYDFDGQVYSTHSSGERRYKLSRETEFGRKIGYFRYQASNK